MNDIDMPNSQAEGHSCFKQCRWIRRENFTNSNKTQMKKFFRLIALGFPCSITGFNYLILLT